ncbi:hypothetical protein J4E86_011279 [Alternaria arbusti]|uniref:uncharacterized protein n=1 Tax=Alternaria arbusti TaxID=232088 RepID=UPI00221E7BDE|nr:uncharacterized protein J4E86_011279 [Alternaria arbusti]KAI4936662.1 hypothetical protein J4E86_011279 [Alternaria arbusti]
MTGSEANSAFGPTPTTSASVGPTAIPAIAPPDKEEDEEDEDESLDGGGGMALDAALDRTSDAVAGTEEDADDTEFDADEVISDVGEAELGSILELLVGAALALASDTRSAERIWQRTNFSVNL